MKPELLNTILGAGGLAFLLALGQGIRWMLDRASAREDRVDKQSQDWQKTMYRRLKYEADQHDWFRDYAGRCESLIIRRLGEEELPAKKPYPREPQEDIDLKAAKS
jgi:hypothetical protein